MTTPPNSSHPTSLEAQAEKSEERFDKWSENDPKILQKGRAYEAWKVQDIYYQPIVEALKKEVEELKGANQRWMKEVEEGHKWENMYRSEIAELKAEVERFRMLCGMSDHSQIIISKSEVESLRKQIEQLTAELERAKDALRTCKYYVYDGQPHYQFDVQKVEAVFNPIDR